MYHGVDLIHRCFRFRFTMANVEKLFYWQSSSNVFDPSGITSIKKPWWHRAMHMLSDPIWGWLIHDDVIKWKHFPRCWPFVRGIHRSPVNSPHKGQWRGALMFPLICVRINGWVHNREAGDQRRYRTHYDVIVMLHNEPLMQSSVLCFVISRKMLLK